jgi:hypothetical protein
MYFSPVHLSSSMIIFAISQDKATKFLSQIKLVSIPLCATCTEHTRRGITCNWTHRAYRLTSSWRITPGSRLPTTCRRRAVLPASATTDADAGRTSCGSFIVQKETREFLGVAPCWHLAAVARIDRLSRSFSV